MVRGGGLGSTMLLTARNGLELHRFASFAAHPGVLAAVAGRWGGVSQAPFATLNGSFRVGDGDGNVTANRQTVCEALGLSLHQVVGAYQTHGTRALVVRSRDAGRGASSMSDALEEADALLTDAAGVYLIMTFADCVPIVLFDPKRQAIALVHAGWKGTLSGIAIEAVQALGNAFGCRPADIMAGIGPSIGPCCYEVGSEVVEQTIAADLAACLMPCQSEGRLHLDLWKANQELLQRSGLLAANIESSDICTACNTDKFFSHRAEGGRTGRFVVLAGLQPS